MPELQNTNASLPTYCATQDDLRQRIRNEWRVEFCLEGGKRMWDIRRWGIAKDVLNAPFEGLKYKIVDNPNDPDKKVDGGKMCILIRAILLFYQEADTRTTTICSLYLRVK